MTYTQARCFAQLDDEVDGPGPARCGTGARIGAGCAAGFNRAEERAFYA